MYSLHVIRELVRLGQGHRFRLYTNGAPPEGLFEPAAPAGIRAIPFPRLWTHARLSLEMLLHPPDVLFVPAHVLPLIHPAASVVTVHDLGYLTYPEAHKPADRRYLDWSTRWNAHQAAAVLADSKATKADLVRAYGAAGREDSRRLPGPGRVAEAGDQSAAAGCRARRSTTWPSAICSTWARSSPAKTWSASFKHSSGCATGPRWPTSSWCWRASKGWLYESLFDQVTRAGMGERVIFPGYIPDEELARAVERSHRIRLSIALRGLWHPGSGSRRVRGARHHL